METGVNNIPILNYEKTRDYELLKLDEHISDCISAFKDKDTRNLLETMLKSRAEELGGV